MFPFNTPFYKVFAQIITLLSWIQTERGPALLRSKDTWLKIKELPHFCALGGLERMHSHPLRTYIDFMKSKNLSKLLEEWQNECSEKVHSNRG